MSTAPYSILSTNIDMVKIFSVLHNKAALLARDVLSREQEIVTKEFLERLYLTIYIEKRLIKVFLTDKTEIRLPFYRPFSAF